MGHYEPQPSYGLLVQSASANEAGAGRRLPAWPARRWWMALRARWSRRVHAR